MSRKRFTNQEVINYIIDDIKDNPSTLLTDISNEQDFISLFGNKTNIELYGTITTEPQAQNIFFSNFYQRIVRKGMVDVLSFKGSYSIFKREDLTYGDRWSRFATDRMNVESFDPTASPMPVRKPRLAECFSDEPFRKLVEFTYSREQIQGMFLKDEGLDELLVELLKKQKQSLDLFVESALFDKIDWSLQGYTTTNESTWGFGLVEDFNNTNIAEIIQNGIVASQMDGQDFKQDLLNHQFKNLKLKIIEQATKMSRPNDIYNIGDSDGKFTSSIPKGEGILLINENLLTALESYGENVYHENSLKKYFKEIIPIQKTGAYNDKLIAFAIVDPNWLEYRVLLEKTLDWTNPRALYTNYFSHLWFGILLNPFVSSYAFIHNDI